MGEKLAREMGRQNEGPTRKTRMQRPMDGNCTQSGEGGNATAQCASSQKSVQMVDDTGGGRKA
jgi:hypothetical protein